MYVSDGDYIQDIEVNDLRNRYMLMKAQTQQSVRAFRIPRAPVPGISFYSWLTFFQIQKETGAGTISFTHL